MLCRHTGHCIGRSHPDTTENNEFPLEQWAISYGMKIRNVGKLEEKGNDFAFMGPKENSWPFCISKPTGIVSRWPSRKMSQGVVIATEKR